MSSSVHSHVLDTPPGKFPQAGDSSGAETAAVADRVADLVVTLRRSPPDQSVGEGETPAQGSGATSVDVDAQRTDKRFHFTKTFTCKDEHGNFKVYSFVVELKGQDLIDAQMQYADIKSRYHLEDNEIISVDLRHLTVTYKSGYVRDLGTEDTAVVKLRELYDKATYVRGLPQSWPRHREHSHGDLGGNLGLQIASERQQKMSEWDKDEFLRNKIVAKRLEEGPQGHLKRARIEKAHEFFEKAPQEIQRMITTHHSSWENEENAERKLLLLQEIKHLEAFLEQIRSMDRFAVYSAILLESDPRSAKSVEEDVKDLASIVETLEPPRKSGYVAKITRAKEPKDATHAEKEYLYDIVLLLGSKTRWEYLALSRLTGQKIKRPALEEALVGALRHHETNKENAAKKLSHHPMMLDSLRGSFHDQFVEFAKTFFLSLDFTTF